MKHRSKTSAPTVPPHSASLPLSEYSQGIAPTDVLDPDDHHSILQGLFGEVGAIMSTVKKVKRESKAYPGFLKAAEEEFGDTLWYFATLCRRSGRNLERVFHQARNHDEPLQLVASDVGGAGVARVDLASAEDLDTALFDLGRAAAYLFGVRFEDTEFDRRLECFAQCYLRALRPKSLSLASIARANMAKARGAFLAPDPSTLESFDDGHDADERLPDRFEITIRMRKSGKSYLSWNGVFIGDPLSDNIAYGDGYRFHDVFHMAHAAILNWSPVFRALIKHKRKSSNADEEQDSGRAIVVEEGLTAWLFARSEELKRFEGQERVSLGILKTIHNFVSGYEVDRCPLFLWQRAILEGYAVFRQVYKNNGGVVIGDRRARTIQHLPLGKEAG